MIYRLSTLYILGFRRSKETVIQQRAGFGRSLKLVQRIMKTFSSCFNEDISTTHMA